jgi:PAS domain-containing protein
VACASGTARARSLLRVPADARHRSLGARRDLRGERGFAGVQREVEQMELQFPEVKATAERPGCLANLLALSYEPMLAWRLDGAIEFWNAGAERLYGFASSEAVGTISHTLLQTNFQLNLSRCVHGFRMSITGRVSYAIPARTATKLL